MRGCMRLTFKIGRIACLVSLAFLLVPPSALYCQIPTWNWTEETIDAQQARFPSIATDSDGNVHLVYSSDTEGFKYGFRSAGSKHWFTMPIEGGAGFTSLTLDSKNNPHVCLAINTSGIIKYGSFEGAKWSFQQIAPGTGPVWYSCSVGVSPDGTPHVSWYQEKGPDLSLYGHYKYAVLKGGAWLVRTIDSDPLTGKWHGMVVDGKGNAHISYDCFVNGELKYSVESGSQWHISVVDSRRLTRSLEPQNTVESVGMGNSLVLDAKGLAHISYQTDSALKYASETGESFKTQVVETVRPWGSWVGYRTGLALDSHSVPHISYEDAGTLKHAYWDGQKWNIQVLARNGSEPYRFSAMAIDKNDGIYIVYRDPMEGSLKLKLGRLVGKSAATEQQKTASTSGGQIGASKPATTPQ
jgi:hypothetical protein